MSAATLPFQCGKSGLAPGPSGPCPLCLASQGSVCSKRLIYTWQQLLSELCGDQRCRGQVLGKPGFIPTAPPPRLSPPCLPHPPMLPPPPPHLPSPPSLALSPPPKVRRPCPPSPSLHIPACLTNLEGGRPRVGPLLGRDFGAGSLSLFSQPFPSFTPVDTGFVGSRF